MRITAPGITLDLPDGWEAEIDDGAGGDAATVTTPRTHIANFALPPERGDFGSGAVDVMRRGDALICLLEEDPVAAGSTLHGRAEGLPVLIASDFDAQAMQRARPGQVGTQAFLRSGDRAFVVYVVVAEAFDLGRQVSEINQVLAGITFT